MKTDCIFCKIIKNELPSDKIYENETTVAFLDISPVSKGHTLIIPKKHSSNIYEIPEEDIYSVFKTVKKLAPVIKKATGASGLTITINNEPASGQTVFHLHVHIIPRFDDDKLILWPQGEYIENEKKEILGKIKEMI